MTHAPSSRFFARLALTGVAAALLAACGVEETGIDPPRDALYNPTGLAMHPDGRYLYLANAVFDRRYNAGTMMVLDTHEGRLMSRSAVEIGLFAGEVIVARPAGQSQVMGFVATRDDDRVIRFDIDAAAGDAPGHLRCASAAGAPCEAPWVIDRFLDGPLADDPYSLDFDGEALLVGHLKRGIVSRWLVAPSATAPTFACAVNLEGGVTELAPHPLLGWIYITDRGGQQLQVLEPAASLSPANLCALNAKRGLLVDPYYDRGHTRGMAFSADGTLLYVANSTDGSLRVYDVTLDANGRPRDRLVSAIPMGEAPNLVRVAGLRPGERRAPDALDRGVTGAAVDAKGEGLVYVTVFNEDLLLVVDPTIQAVIHRIEIEGGPHDIAFGPDADGALRGYVSGFKDHRVSVLDLEPGSATRFTLLRTVP
ncbi:YncE family protein [Myxococcota bacterium]|nr:YncE family protein [Myxococcota bacterium]MBU1430320.1 YncE family protein [Myxococcota bacterium]MBU1900596.1 YncE family protein [Myxococcota bacterium]